MSQLRYLFLVCSIAFFACTNDVAGTWEDENTVAQQSSSSDATITSSDNGILWIDSIQADVYSGCVSDLKIVYIGEAIVMPDTNEPKPSAIKGSFTTNTIVLSKFIEGRVAKLIASGIPESEADSIAKWELFKAIGIDTYLRANTDASPIAINSAINYIFGGTTGSDFYKNVNETFSETGTLQPEHYCNFDESSVLGTSIADYELRLPITYSNRLYARYILYNDSDYHLKGCSGSTHLIIPSDIVNNVQSQCLNLPHCDSTIKDTIIKSSYNNLGKRAFICRESGWDAATDKEAETYGIPCDKEGKYIVHSKQPEYSYMCSLDSGWHAVHTIDAETFDVPCDKYGKLFKSPNRPNITYVCKDVNTIALSGKLGLYSCRTISIQDPYSPHASCRKVGWEIAKLIDFETADVECDSEGKTHQSPSDSTLYYVCHQNKWTEFYNAPCDTDNKRIKTNKYSGFFICYNKTWRHSSSWRTDYPAEYYLNPDLEYGHFTDPRDNREYNTIEYKDKIWMAENMKYEGASETEQENIIPCYSHSDCDNVGRYYNHEIAGKICPDGWRLPDSSDIIALGDTSIIAQLYSQLGGMHPNSLDPYGMSLLPTEKTEIKRSSSSVLIREKSSTSNGFSTFLWLNETGSNGKRLYTIIGSERGIKHVDFQWYTPQPDPYIDGKLFLPVRCIKK